MNQTTGKSDNELESKALFTYNVSDLIGKEYVDVFYDMSRMLVIQFVIQFLMYLTGSSQGNSFFNIDFFVLCIYVVLGVVFYWLIFKKIIKFE